MAVRLMMLKRCAWMMLVLSVTLALPAAGQNQGAGVPAPAAEAEPPAEEGGAQALVQAGTAMPPGQAWRDVRLLWTASRLGLTGGQAQQIAPVLAQLQTAREATRKQRQELWAQGQEALGAVVTQWMAGRPAPAQQKPVADQVADQATALDNQDEAALETALQAVSQLLSPEQLALVESQDDAALRLEARRRLEGASSAAEYIVRHAEAHRALMPDEYMILRVADATRVAGRLVSPQEPGYPQVEAALLQLFDQLSNWSDEQFAAERPTLVESVRQYLQLQEGNDRSVVRHGEFIDWLEDPRTAKYMAVYGAATAALPPDAEEVPDRDDLARALDVAGTVSLLNDLGLDVQQLTQLLSLASGARAVVQQAEMNREALVASTSQHLTAVIPYLVSGQRLDDQWSRLFEDFSAGLKDHEQSVDGELAGYVAAVERILTPRQASFVDWRVPPEVAGAQAPEERARIKRMEAALIADALDLIEGLRFLDQWTLNQLRPARVGAFLQEFMEPGTARFERAREEIYGLIQDSRAVGLDEWREIAPEVAVRVLQAAGQLAPARWRPSDRPLDWWAVRDLLASPDIEATLQQILTARGAG